MENLKAALYCRVSKEKQLEGFSITAQLKQLRDYCKNNNIIIFREYIEDEAISGQKENRPQFQKMINECGNFNLVLVHRFDRFARKVEISRKIKNVFRENKVTVVSVTEPIEDSPIGFVMEYMLDVFAEYYIRNLSREAKKGHVQRAVEGYHNGSLPFGYYSKDKLLYIKDDEAETVRLIFKLYLQGLGCNKIAKYLRDYNIPTQKFAKWEFFQVWRILRNVKYIGKIYYDGQIYDGNHEAIIDLATWEKVERMRKTKATVDNTGQSGRRANYWYMYYLSGILYCGECGGNFRLNKSGGRWKYYVCGRAIRYVGKCDWTKSFNTKKLEMEIENILYDFMQGKVNFTPRLLQDTSKYSVLANRKKKVSEELKRAKAAYLGKIFDLDEYKEVRQKLENESIELEAEMKRVKLNKVDEDDLSSKVKTIWDLFVNEKDICEKRAILQQVIHRIYLYKNGNCEIIFQAD
jgi:site-specific DNA recombinase